VDVTWIYEQWRDELASLMQLVADRFELEQDPSTNGLEVAGELGSGIHGQVQCFAGPDIDWMVYSWMADPKNGFANLHLTISPGAHVDLPTFGLAFANFGIRPWGFVDSVPRRDLTTNPDYHDRYYGSINERWLEIRRDNPQLDWFTSPTSYIRAVTSPTAFCYSGPMEQKTVDIIQGYGREHLERWIGWWDGAEPTPVEERAALSAYTEDARRTIAVLDPANSVAVRLFGQDICDSLVSALWGADRTLPRAGV
jgi:Red chlorophyll catabolite reductase (RCC reductase)